ncbi:MAG: 50S ribosomal protein L7/L12 [bacterium]
MADEEKNSVADKTAESKEEKKEVEVPSKFKDLVAEIEKMSVLDLSELVKVLEEKFGVSAAAPMAAMAVMPTDGAPAGAVEEKTEFDVELTSYGESKINVIKVVKEITGKGLADAKALVDGAPVMLREGVKKEEAEEIKKKIEEAGGAVSLK